MLEVVIPFPEYNDDDEAIQFIKYLQENQKKLNLESATVYYKFPMFKEFNEEVKSPDFFIVSPYHGVVIITKNNRDNRTLDDEALDKIYEETDSIYSLVLSKLIKIPGLRKKRSRNELRLPLSTMIYLPNYNEALEDNEEGNYWANDLSKLESILTSLKVETLGEEVLTDIYSVVDGTRNMPRPVKRNLNEADETTKGAILSELDLQIAKFDQKQKIAALTIIDGPQRIRGMAGSGKTIILAMKAALIHMENPDAKILYTFYTKSLYDQIKQLITRFYRSYEDHDPNWDNIHILHAWGGRTLPGVYYNTCVTNGITPLNLSDAKFGARKAEMNDFEYVCYDLLSRTNGNIKSMYDYVLMDEGQDFSKTFYWLCRKLAVNDRLVWAYDELQNILNIELQETMELFQNEFGDNGISLSELQDNHPFQNNDIVLHKSYRNPREILLAAHAVGFGLYNDKAIQILENKEHWEDLGYEVKQGECRKGEHTVIHRPEQNSPSLISKYFSANEIIKTYNALNMSDECQWVSEQIEKDIESNLLAEDIMVICLDDKYARKYFEEIERILEKEQIYVNNVLNSYSGDNFIVKGKVTLTTVYRAKGNESASVYVVGADSLGQIKKYDILSRNKLFTAFTRAKAWLSLSGVGEDFNYIIEEINMAKSNFPDLIFDYPGFEEIKTLRRELALQSAEMNRKREKLLEQLDEMGIDRHTALSLLQDESDK
ncbi:ATP-binding domain-containing protein [Rummeliibacillus stabekisii]|uniref:DEAD/DEAH box helicase n=1 Tax=Rummeliibacillus stabekisii TaxID=241244 RepID=UPI0020425B86|nr:ATP-binding domain-containing protein [Rummeliibacillus stabekisii]MCM3318058.1 ATP-binding domain-containing protein [Rummeliibacillus stabekisii]